MYKIIPTIISKLDSKELPIISNVLLYSACVIRVIIALWSRKINEGDGLVLLQRREKEKWRFSLIFCRLQGGSVLNVASKRCTFSVPEGYTHNKCQCGRVTGWHAVTGTSLCLGITSHSALEPEVREENEQGPKQNKAHNKKFHYRKVYKSILYKTTSLLRNSTLCSGDMHWNE